MLKLAAENLIMTKCHLWNDNVLDSHVMTKEFDIVFSHGVLEHFNNDEIKIILDQCRDCSAISISYVPSNLYEVSSRGGERLMSVKEWLTIYPFKDIIEFNEGKDLILIS